MSARVITVVDAKVDPAREGEFLDGYRRMAEGPRPEGLLHSELLRGQDGSWRIETTWRDLDTIKAARSSGARPAALDLVERVGAQHTHSWYTLEQSHEFSG
ncbi:MAG: antibiotic biosynthesis monooxygenase [Myxococcales bacterium]